MKNTYLALAVLGVILKITQLLPWFDHNGFNVSLFLTQIMSSKVAAFAWVDVLITIATLLVFMRKDGPRRGVPYIWLPIIGSIFFGAAFALPLYLYLREVAKEKHRLPAF